MAVQTNVHTISDLASANFSALTMGRFVQHLGAAGLTLCPSQGAPDGVINNSPAAGGTAELIVGHGKVRIEAGAVVAEGDLVVSDDLGRAVPSTVYGAGDVICGRALSAAAAAGQEITIIFYGAGGARTD